MIKFSFIIPVFGKIRIPYLRTFILNYETYIKSNETELIVVEMYSGHKRERIYNKNRKIDKYTYVKSDYRYERSRLLNTGSARASGEFLIFHDNDILVPRHFFTLLKAQAKKLDVFANFNKLLYLSPILTKQVLQDPISTGFGFNIKGVSGKERALVGNYGCGGSLTISRSLFRAIGGWNETFRGYGKEDKELGVRLWAINRDPRKTALNVKLFHLAHKPSQQRRFFRAHERFLKNTINNPKKKIKELKAIYYKKYIK